MTASPLEPAGKAELAVAGRQAADRVLGLGRATGELVEQVEAAPDGRGKALAETENRKDPLLHGALAQVKRTPA